MKEFKIRASACGQIMGVKGLGKTGENYVKTWLKEQIYDRKKEFTSKYTDKGLIVEDNSLDFIADELKIGFIVKNEQFYENDFFQGTPDVVLKDLIIDVKNSWDCFSFPLLEDEIPNIDYFYQLQVYMALTGRKKAKLIYVLSDTPENLIEKEAYWWCKNNGYDELDADIYDAFVKKMTYSEIPNNLKMKIFDIDYDEKVIEKIKERVLECRNLIKSYDLRLK